VDPVHAHSKPLELDESILTAGRALAAILRGKLHVVHANHPPLHSLASDTPFTIEDARAIGRREFEKLMSRSDMAARRGHLRDGDPARVIPEVADDIHARVVVMGAVSRSGLKRLFIGNTAERVFGKLACDVLVVKPTVFRKRVPAAHREVPVLTPAPVSVLAH
jgi:universal stress protein E